MVIKTEVYYDLVGVDGNQVSDSHPAVLRNLIKAEMPDKITVDASFWGGAKVIALKQSDEQLLEKLKKGVKK